MAAGVTYFKYGVRDTTLVQLHVVLAHVSVSAPNACLGLLMAAASTACNYSRGE